MGRNSRTAETTASSGGRRERCRRQREPPRGPGLGRREEADALPTLLAPRPPAPRTGAPSSPQGAVLHLSPRCALRGGPVLSCPAVPPAPGDGHTARAADVCHGPARPGPFRPQRGSPLGCPSPSALRNPRGTALRAAAAGSHVSGALCGSTRDVPARSWAPLSGPAAAALLRCPVR